MIFININLAVIRAKGQTDRRAQVFSVTVTIAPRRVGFHPSDGEIRFALSRPRSPVSNFIVEFESEFTLTIASFSISFWQFHKTLSSETALVIAALKLMEYYGIL
jgi:hypothetical protein